MLSIERTRYHSPCYWWMVAWLRILDCLFSILTLQFLYCNLAEWPLGRSLGVRAECSLSFKGRIRWWIGNWVAIFGSLFSILTLGYLHTNWTNWFYTD